MTNEVAIKELRDASDSEVRYGDTKYHYDKVMKRVEALEMAIKALEQARPKGKWSRPSVVAMPYSFAYECPICRQWGNIQTFEPNYCPNCGADMRGEGDE